MQYFNKIILMVPQQNRSFHIDLQNNQNNYVELLSVNDNIAKLSSINLNVLHNYFPNKTIEKTVLSVY